MGFVYKLQSDGNVTSSPSSFSDKIKLFFHLILATTLSHNHTSDYSSKKEKKKKREKSNIIFDLLYIPAPIKKKKKNR